jgi:hypothetical protein
MLVIFTCMAVAACGSTTNESATNDVATSDDAAADTTDSDIANGSDTLSGDIPLTDTTSYKYGTCAAVTDCAQAACANSKDSACAKDCLAGANPAAAPTATALLSCIQTKCMAGECKNSTDPKCVSSCATLRCMPAIFECIEDGKSGSGSCGDIKGCFDTCNASGTNVMGCLQTCYGKVSADAKAKGKVFATCVANAPAGSDPTAACLKETIGCFVDGKTGTKGCYESMPCLSACGQSADPFNCALKCIGEMTKPAQDAYAEVSPCLGQDVTPAAGCDDKLVVCLAPTGTQTCEEALGCVMGCDKQGGGNDDPTCVFSCLHNTTAAADKLLLTKLGCNPADPGCSEGIISCIAPSGSATCPAVISCATGCSLVQGQSPDMACIFGCIKKGSTATANAAYGVLNCMGKPDNAGCVDQEVACYQPSGTSNCPQVTTCVQTCYANGGDVGTCQTGCYSAASVSGFKDFLAWSTCQQGCSASCKNDQTCTNSCTDTQCPVAKSACTPK